MTAIVKASGSALIYAWTAPPDRGGRPSKPVPDGARASGATRADVAPPEPPAPPATSAAHFVRVAHAAFSARAARTARAARAARATFTTSARYARCSSPTTRGAQSPWAPPPSTLYLPRAPGPWVVQRGWKAAVRRQRPLWN